MQDFVHHPYEVDPGFRKPMVALGPEVPCPSPQTVTLLVGGGVAGSRVQGSGFYG